MKQILIIDDKPENLKLIAAMLGRYLPDCRILTAVSGPDGIEMAAAKQPDTVLLDLSMPDMDGFEVCQRLKRAEATAHIPVILLTGVQKDVKSRVKGLDIGADAFLTKPIGGPELASQIQVMFRIKESEDLLRQERDHLEEAVAQRTRDLAHQASVNQAVAELSQALISSTSLDVVAAFVLEKAQALTGSRYGFVGYIEEETGYLICPTMTSSVWTVCEIPEKDVVFKSFKGLWGWVLQNRKPLLSNDPAADPRSSGTQDGHIHIQRFLGVPAVVEQRLLGLIGLANPESEYTEADLEVTQRLADLYALAVARSRTEKELITARNRAEAANQAKNEFFSNISHELRTPMHGILGMLDLALETDMNRQQREYLEMARSSADNLRTLLNDIFAYIKLESGGPQLRKNPFNLRVLIKSVARPLRILAAQKGLGLRCDISPVLPEDILGDPDHIRHVLSHLLKNAVKFTEKGVIHIQVTPEKAGESQPLWIKFSVSDTGVGIPEEKLESIFEPFVQADGSLNRRYGGAGLGLNIARRLIRFMGGDIRVQSRPQQGSTFCFSLPFSASPPPAASGATAGPGPEHRPRRLPASPREAAPRPADGLQSARDLARTLKRALDQADAEKAEDQAGLLWKQARQMGAKKLSDLAFRMSLALRKEEISHCLPIYKQLIQVLDDLEPCD